MLAPKFLALATAVSASLAFANDAQVPLGHGLNVATMDNVQRESLLLDLFSAMDIEDVMTLTGHGEELLGNRPRLVRVFGESEAHWMTEADKLRLKRAGKDFEDLTETPNLGMLNAQRASQLYDKPPVSKLSPEDKDDVRKIWDGITDEHLRADIEKLTSFWNRNSYSNWGKLSSEWVQGHVTEILAGASKKVKTTVSAFPHSFPQSSVIAHIEAAGDDTTEKKLVILGAHQDSLNYRMPFFRSPGADDDGSGTVTIMQVLRSLVGHDFVPPAGVAVEFHWYAAEERGLLGSRDIAAAYEKEGALVAGMLQMDMTAWVAKGTSPQVGLFTELTTPALTNYTANLVDQYLDIPWIHTGCGLGCGSDHSSWTGAGYPGAFATEGRFEDFQPRIHTPYDDLGDEEYSFAHMLDFVKLGIAYVVELSASA